MSNDPTTTDRPAFVVQLRHVVATEIVDVPDDGRRVSAVLRALGLDPDWPVSRLREDLSIAAAVRASTLGGEYPESSSACYIDTPVDTTLVLDAGGAANFISSLISEFTGDEVDGDGDPWGIACDHLHGLLHNVAELLGKHPDVVREMYAEYGYRGGVAALSTHPEPPARPPAVHDEADCPYADHGFCSAPYDKRLRAAVSVQATPPAAGVAPRDPDGTT